MIEVYNWDKLITETYKRPYNFQQQNGCQSRGVVNITIPSNKTYDNEMHDSIPEEINGDIMGVKFEKWLERDPEMSIDSKIGCDIELFWKRNFYPDLQTIANDLYKKGLINIGEYVINIDW